MDKLNMDRYKVKVATILFLLILLLCTTIFLDNITTEVAHDGIISTTTSTKKNSTLVHKQTRDYNVFNNDYKFSAIVVEKYKLIWFLNPKAGSTSTRYLLYRMIYSKHADHYPDNNDLPTHRNYNHTTIQSFLKSKEWTRVITLRDPKERFLSAYLDKEERFHKKPFSDDDPTLFRQMCCWKQYINDIKPFINGDDCKKHNYTFNEFVNVTKACPNIHWLPQVSILGDNWKIINFVIDFEYLADDAERLLKNLGNNAWEEFGASGWGDNGTNAVFRQNEHIHSDAALRYNEYYTPELEKIVEERFEDDYSLLKQRLPTL